MTPTLRREFSSLISQMRCDEAQFTPKRVDAEFIFKEVVYESHYYQIIYTLQALSLINVFLHALF